MFKKRFFATLAFAHHLISRDKARIDLLIATYRYGYTDGWQDKSMEVK